MKSAYLYGWDNITHMRKKLQTRYQGLIEDEATATDQYETTKRALYMIKGALQLLNGEAQSDLLKSVGKKIPAKLRVEATGQLAADEAKITNDFEGAKRSLHECRGAKNNVAWMLKNYWPGDSPIQDVPRTQASITLAPTAAEPPKSDGKNRIMELVTE